MQTGLIIAIFAALSFAIGIVMVRKAAGDAGEAFTVTVMSIFAGIPLFIVAISASGGWADLAHIPLKALGMFAAVGIIHFVAGRLLAYEAFRLIGANRATPITQISPDTDDTFKLAFFKGIANLFYYLRGNIYDGRGLLNHPGKRKSRRRKKYCRGGNRQKASCCHLAPRCAGASRRF